MSIRFHYGKLMAIFQITRSEPEPFLGGIMGISERSVPGRQSMEVAMFESSTVGSHALRHRRATLIDALWAAASRGSAWLIAAIINELRIRRDMRQLAAMDDHMLKDIGLRRCEIEDCVRHGRSG
jgi:uncharacterized protein YjiS (DUF1127 family)